MDTLAPGSGNRNPNPAGQGQTEARSQSGRNAAERVPGFTPGLAAASVEAWVANAALFSWAQDQAERLARIWLDQGRLSREQARSTPGDVAIQQRQVPVGDLTAEYLTAGEGPPLVLLHGDGHSARSWLWVMPALARTHRVYAPYLPGFGTAAKPGDYSPAFFAGFVRAFLDTLGIAQATVVGNSNGGLVALHLAQSDPARVVALGLVDSAGLGWEINPALAALTLPGYGAAAIHWTRTPLGTAQRVWLYVMLQFWRSERVPREWLEEQYRVPTIPGFLEATVGVKQATLDAMGQREVLLEALPHLTVPTLVIWGANDIVIPVHHARAAVARLPRGHLALIPDCGHLPHLERPEHFVAALGRFLAEHRDHRHHAGETGSVGATGGGGKEVDDGLSPPRGAQAADRAG